MTAPTRPGRLAVVVPTIAAHGFLNRCVRSVLDQRGPQSDVLLVQNGPAVDLVCAYWRSRGVSVHRPRWNIGVAGAWNAGCRWAWRRGHDAVVLLNDDLALTDPQILTRFRAAVDGDPRSLYFLTGRGFGAACMTRVVWDELGPFDEGFWPAYHEDNDMHRRAALAGIPWRDVEGASEHLGSAAIGTDPDLAALNRQTFPLTQQRYVAKWGGLPGGEQFSRPFGGASPSAPMREPASLAPTSTTPRRRRIPPPRRRPRILVVIGVLNGFDLLADSLGRLVAATDEADVLLIDNGSDLPLAREPWMPAGVRVVRNETNRGTYPLFGQVLTLADRAEILAFLHQDLWVHERGWDDRVRRAFADDDRLGLVGFVGSSQIDDRGGRGLGTMLNFSGIGLASPAEEHGRRVAELRPAVVVDGCAMVFRRRTLEEIGTRPDFPPHHFYDRLMSCQVVEAGWRVGVLGVACDHLGNQTAGTQPSWHELARQWAEGHGLPGAPGRWDEAVYLEAERRFLEEWRDEKRFVPLFIADDWTVWRPS